MLNKESLVKYVTTIPFVMLLITALPLSDQLGNGIVSAKYFWFYGCMSVISITTFLSLFSSNRKIKIHPGDLLFIVFCIYGIFISYYHHQTLTNKTILLVLIFTLYFYLRIFVSQRSNQITILTFTLLFTGFIESSWGIAQLYGVIPSQHTHFKITGTFFNPGPYAGYLAVTAPLAFYYLLNDNEVLRKKEKHPTLFHSIRWGIAALTFLLIAVILPATMSRAAWIASISGLTIVGVTVFRQKRKKNNYFTKLPVISKKKATLFSIAILTTILLVLLPAYKLKQPSADGRLFIWKNAIQLIKEHPFGIGVGNFAGKYGEQQAAWFLSGQSTEMEKQIAGSPEYAFNEFIQICVEHGIGSFILFILFITNSIIITLKNKRYHYLASFVSLLLFAFFSYPFNLLPFIILFIFLAVICSSDPSPIHQEKTKGSIGKKIVIPLYSLLVVLTLLCIGSRYPSYHAYKRWKQIQPLYAYRQYEIVTKEYKVLFPLLEDELQFLFEYAQSLARLHQFEESNKILEKAITISNDPMLYNSMGKNNQSIGNYELAEKCYIKSVNLLPGRLYPYYLLTKLYEEKGETKKAIQMAETVLTMEPKIPSTAISEMKEEMNALKIKLTATQPYADK